MKHLNANNSRLIATLLLVVSAVLLVFSGTQGARAALTYYSETYAAQVNMYDIGITLVENGSDVSYRNYTQKDNIWNESTGALLAHMLDEDKTVKLGKAYPEVLTVRNSGNIDQYVRVKVRCYWLDKDGNKVTTISPDLIDLNLLTDGKWIEDTASATAERHVLYYTDILPIGASSEPFSDTLTIDGKVANLATVTTNEANGTITTSYDYDGMTFQIEAEADAVQTHNAADAIKSAWGVNVTVADDGSLHAVA